MPIPGGFHIDAHVSRFTARRRRRRRPPRRHRHLILRSASRSRAHQRHPLPRCETPPLERRRNTARPPVAVVRRAYHDRTEIRVGVSRAFEKVGSLLYLSLLSNNDSSEKRGYLNHAATERRTRHTAPRRESRRRRRAETERAAGIVERTVDRSTDRHVPHARRRRRCVV